MGLSWFRPRCCRRASLIRSPTLRRVEGGSVVPGRLQTTPAPRGPRPATSLCRPNPHPCAPGRRNGRTPEVPAGRADDLSRYGCVGAWIAGGKALRVEVRRPQLDPGRPSAGLVGALPWTPPSWRVRRRRRRRRCPRRRPRLAPHAREPGVRPRTAGGRERTGGPRAGKWRVEDGNGRAGRREACTRVAARVRISLV